MNKNHPQEAEERRTVDRRAQVLNGARTVFAEKGYHRATTKEIARAAGVAEGTIYLYFQTKGDLLLAMLEQLAEIDQREARHEAGLQIDLESLYRERLIQKAENLGPYFDLLVAILPEVLADPTLRERYYQQIVEPGIQSLQQQFERRAQAGETDPEKSALAARMMVGSLLGLEILYILGDPLTRSIWQNPGEHAAPLVELLFAGVQRKDRPAE